jgi:AcrR family transcriptional regulator
MSTDPGNGADLIADLLEEIDLPRIPQQRRSWRKRDAILHAGAQRFAAQGYERTTTVQIAKTAGVSVGSLYSYFRDKRQVFLSLTVPGFQGLIVEAPQRLDPTRPQASLREFLDLAYPSEPRGIQLRRLWAGMEVEDPVIRDFGGRLRQPLTTALTGWVHVARQAGLTHPKLNLQAGCQFLVETLMLVGPHMLSEPTDLPGREKAQRALADSLFHSLFLSPS